MPKGWLYKRDLAQDIYCVLAMARTYKSLAQYHIFKTHYECLGLLEVPIMISLKYTCFHFLNLHLN